MALATEVTVPAGGEAGIELPGLWTLRFSPSLLGGPQPGCSLEVPPPPPQGFLDGRGLTSCLFCFLTLWVSRGRVESQERT